MYLSVYKFLYLWEIYSDHFLCVRSVFQVRLDTGQDD